MSLLEKLTADVQAALKNRDTERLSTLRLAVSAITYRRIERQAPLSEEDEIEVLRKQVKQREDAIAEYLRAGRPERAEQERRERDILAEYLPTPLSPDELRAAVRDILAGLGPKPEFGAAMKAAMAALRGRAPGKDIAAAVRAALDTAQQAS